MSYNRILPHKLVKYDVFKVTVQGVSWIPGVRQVRLAESALKGRQKLKSRTHTSKRFGMDGWIFRALPNLEPI